MNRAILRQALSQATDVGAYAPLADALGFTPIKHPINYLADTSSETSKRLDSVAASLSRVGAFQSERAHAGLWVAVLPEWGDRGADRDLARRRLAKVLVELAPALDRNVLLFLTKEGVDDIEVVLPRVRSNGSVGTVRALVNRSEPTRFHLELFESLILEPGDETVAVTRRWSDAFNVEKVTKSFYLEFRALRDRLVEVLKSENPTNPLLAVVNDEVAESDLRRYATRNLGRVLFLWFIQSKGWLNNDAQYLLNLYNTRCRTGRDHGFFRESLIPLFFDALAKKPDDRPEAARSLGDLPYLNGGLFTQTAFEDRLYGEEREHVDVLIPNGVFDRHNHNAEEPTVLGLLSSYRFTTRESTPDDQSLDPDPELLGKVFENLNEDRKETGTYYTPREVVRFMCREAIDGYLRDVTGINDEVLHGLRRKALDPAASDIHLSLPDRHRLEQALLNVRVCDPAVGSGAFPVGMLQEIIQLLIGIEQSADVSVSVGGQRVAEWKEKIITNCLYGVDINPEAVEICHLRLWLSMVIDADRPVPLPNLDFRFEAGDSLVDRIAELSLRYSLPRDDQSALALGAESDALHELERLRAEYSLATDPAETRRLRTSIKEAQLCLVRVQVDELIVRSNGALKDRYTRLHKMRRLGARAAHTRITQMEAEDIGKRVEILERYRNHLSPDAPYKKPFLWPVEFPEVFDHGGFDILVANPPYVRQEKLAPDDQQAYAASFPEVHAGTADLLVYFFARGIGILRTGGWLTYITSNKYMRADYGAPLRMNLLNTLDISWLIDFGHLHVFDADTFPAVLIAKKVERQATHSTRPLVVARLREPIRANLAMRGVSQSVENVRQELEDLDDYLVIHARPADREALLDPLGWIIQDEALGSALRRIRQQFKPLREVAKSPLQYGIKTGLNEAFVVDSATAQSLWSDSAYTRGLIKGWVRGQDIEPWQVILNDVKVIALQSSNDQDCAHPWKECRTESEAERVFKSTCPRLYEHMRRFKSALRRRTDKGRFWWELRSCAYYSELSRGKLVWKDIAYSPSFAWEGDGMFVANTAFFCSGLEPAVMVILNSKCFAWLANCYLGEAKDAYLRWLTTDLAMVPFPEWTTTLREKCRDLLTNRVVEDSSNATAYEAYGVTREERDAIEKWYKARLESETVQSLRGRGNAGAR